MSTASIKVVRISDPQTSLPYSASNLAPPLALVIGDVSVPSLEPGYILVRVRAATVARDELTWPELYAYELRIPGYNFAGAIVKVYEDDSSQFQLEPSDEVFVMIHLYKGAAWAESTNVRILVDSAS